MAKRLISLAVSTTIALLSPGLGVYEALAQVVGQNVAATPAAPLALPVNMAGAALNSNSLIGSQALPTLLPGPALPGVDGVKPTISLQLAPSAGLAKPQAAGTTPLPAVPGVYGPTGTKAQEAAPTASRAPVATPVSAPMARLVPQASVAPHTREAAPMAIPVTAPMALPVAGVPSSNKSRKAAADEAKPAPEGRQSPAPTLDKASKGVASALRAFRTIPMDSAEGAAGIAERLERALTGETTEKDGLSEAVPAPGSDDNGSFRRSRLGTPALQQAKPAGKDSIEAAARTYDGPPAQTRIGAFFTRLWNRTLGVLGLTLKTSLILTASGAAVLLSVPLFYGGSVLAGSFLLASGLAVAALPLLGKGTPKLVRPLPGAAFLGLGAALAWLSPTFGGILTAALAGYGAFALIRHAFIDSQKPFYGGKALSAWLGGMGVLLGIGMLLTPAPALAAFWSNIVPASALAAAQWASLAVAALLLIHMPDSVRSLIGKAFSPLSAAFHGLMKRLGLEGSPTLRERLKGLWDGKLAKSRWNALWLAPMWLPFLASDALRWTFSSKGRSTIGRIAGFSLLTLGVGTMLAVPYFVLALGTPLQAAVAVAQTNAFWLGLAGTLGGWGLIHYSGPNGPAQAPWHETAGVALAAFATLAGVGTAFMGLTGTAAILLPAGAYLASPLLLRELPRWLGQGFLSAGQGFRYGYAKARSILAGVQSRSRFYQNLQGRARGEWRRTRYKAWLPIVLGLASWPVRIAGELLAAALGLVWGLALAPVNFLRGALQEARPGSAVSRFVEAFASSAERHGIGGEGYTGRWLAAQLPALGEVNPETKGPTGKAWLGFLQATLAQLGWLAGLVAWTPVVLVWALVDGFKAALR